MINEHWSVGRAGCVVSDTPQRPQDAEPANRASDLDYYGGYCVCESIATVEKANVLAASLDLLAALKALFDDYKRLADSGDAGNWSLEGLAVGQQTLAAIAKAEGQ